MIFSFRVGLTDSEVQQMQLFFLSVSVQRFLATPLPDVGKVRIAKIILLRQKNFIKRCYFQFKKDRPDLRDPATMYTRSHPKVHEFFFFCSLCFKT
jgi:hypothetical protein